MNDRACSAAASKRIAHIKSHVEALERDTVARASSHVRNGTGSPKGSAMSLSNHAMAKAMESWFDKGDLHQTRRWSHVAAKLDQRVCQVEADKSQGGGVFGLLFPLLSNDRVVIDWFASFDEPFFVERVENHKTLDFWAYQTKVALRGEWDRLIDRCARVMADPPHTANLQKYFGDHRFYLALANGDRPGMESVLHELVQPRAVKARSSDDGGFAADLISTAAVIYAKIAWMHGHEVRVDSPYIPAEWLPCTPLERYDSPYDFLA